MKQTNRQMYITCKETKFPIEEIVIPEKGLVPRSNLLLNWFLNDREVLNTEKKKLPLINFKFLRKQFSWSPMWPDRKVKISVSSLFYKTSVSNLARDSFTALGWSVCDWYFILFCWLCSIMFCFGCVFSEAFLDINNSETSVHLQWGCNSHWFNCKTLKPPSDVFYTHKLWNIKWESFPNFHMLLIWRDFLNRPSRKSEISYNIFSRIKITYRWKSCTLPGTYCPTIGCIDANAESFKDLKWGTR